MIQPHTTSKHKLHEFGFTLVEIVIVLPIISIILPGMVDFTVRQYSKMHTETSRANLQLEVETMLLDLEDELLFTTEYAQTKSSDLTDTWQPTGGWTYNTNPDTMIVYETALTAPRRDPNREFVYKNTYGCSGGSSAYNPIALNNLIYFTAPNGGSNQYKTLYRRTITPAYSTCNTNYKVKTCPSASVGSNGCTRADSKLSEKVVDFQVQYFDDNNVATTDPLAAELVKITVILGEKLFGESVTVDSSITMKKIN
jgi:type II secretory pathway pseudopilin PulG